MAKKRQKDEEPQKKRRHSEDDDDLAAEKPKSNLVLIRRRRALLLCCCGVGGVGGGGWLFRDKLGFTKVPLKKDDGNKEAIAFDGPRDRNVDVKPGPKPIRKPDFVTTAEALFKEFDIKDNFAAKAKYQGKIIEVTGEVQNVANQTRFALVGDKTVFRPGGKTHNISCEVMPEYEEKAVALAVGQKVKVIGRFKTPWFFRCD